LLLARLTVRFGSKMQNGEVQFGQKSNMVIKEIILILKSPILCIGKVGKMSRGHLRNWPDNIHCRLKYVKVLIYLKNFMLRRKL
jgi:hypothetical protein